MKVTVVLLTHHRLKQVKLCLESIFLNKTDLFEIEIIALVNGKDEKTESYIKSVDRDYENFKYITLEESIPVGEARNEIINKSESEFLCFLDDDVEIPKNYFFSAEKIVKEYPNIDVFGGPDQAKKNGNEFQRILSEVMKSFFAMGPTRLRHTNVHRNELGSEINLILCNLWMRKSLFDEGFGFPKGYIRNEENILMAKLSKAGKKLRYFSDLTVFHERKQSVKKLIRVTYLSGKFRTIGFFDESSTLNIWFFVPQVYMLSLAICGLIDIKYFGVIALTYLVFITILSIKICKKLKLMNKIYLSVMCYLIYNNIYPLGQFAGYLSKISNRKKNE